MKSLSELIAAKKRKRFYPGEEKKIEDKLVEKVFTAVILRNIKNLVNVDIKRVLFKEGKVSVTTSHPGIANELWRMREKIRKETNAEINCEIIKQIRIN